MVLFIRFRVYRVYSRVGSGSLHNPHHMGLGFRALGFRVLGLRVSGFRA